LIQIRIQHFRLSTDSDPDPIRIQGFDDKKVKKFSAEKKFKFFFIKNSQFTYPYVFIKDVQVKKEAFSSQKRHPALPNMKFLNFFLLFWVIFDLDPKPWGKQQHFFQVRACKTAPVRSS
jgi:hypothetical protein